MHLDCTEANDRFLSDDNLPNAFSEQKISGLGQISAGTCVCDATTQSIGSNCVSLLLSRMLIVPFIY